MATAKGAPADAEQRLREAVRTAPGDAHAYVNLASLLCREDRADEALALLDHAIETHPSEVWPWSLKAGILTAERRIGETIPLHQQVLVRVPTQPVPWLNYGHALQAVGRAGESETAYRKCLGLDPTVGAAWLGLANLRSIRFAPENIRILERALDRTADALNRAQLHFALGRAFADQAQFDTSFGHYRQGNIVRGQAVPYDPEKLSRLVDRLGTTFDTEFFGERRSTADAPPGPIFIVGMPRSGSTLVEQILSSHPMVEGLGELFELGSVAAQIGADDEGTGWIERIGAIEPSDRAELGARYLASIRRFRRSDSPFFTDKMPANWRLIGLVALILPNAKIIDVRRDPVACCFSNFTTYFNRQTSMPTSLEEWAGYYRDYVRALDVYGTRFPGMIYRTCYESLIRDPEAEIRRLLSFVGLPFDPGCLRFHESKRSILTPSAQQVRKPINREGLDRWRNYEPWLRGLVELVPQTSQNRFPLGDRPGAAPMR